MLKYQYINKFKKVVNKKFNVFFKKGTFKYINKLKLNTKKPLLFI